MHRPRRGHHALVIPQRAAPGEIQPPPLRVRHAPARLAHNHVPRRVVPDLLPVVPAAADRQPEVQVGGAAGDGAVLGLGVHADAGARDAEAGGDGGLVAVRRVGRLDALAERGGRDVREDGSHADRPAGLQGAGAQGAAGGGAGARDGGEEDAAAVGAAGVVDVGVVVVVDGEVRAAQHADLDGSVFDQGEADGVLAAAEEALGAVDGVQGPDPAVRAAGAVALVDGLEHLPLVFNRTAELALGS